MPDPHHLTLVLLVFAGVIGGVISSISGGGGLLIMPLFLFLGLTPLQAIATQDLYSVPAHASATWYFGRRGHLSRQVLWFVPVVFILGGVGALAVGFVPTPLLKFFVPVVLIGLAVWAALNPSLKPSQNKQRLSFAQFGLAVLPLLAFYDGFFGVSSTTFYTLAYLTLLNRQVVEATAVAKVFSATSSFAALLIFIVNGNIVWSYGLAMAAGGIVGAQIGAHLVVKHGAVLVRWLVVITSIAASLKLLSGTIAAGFAS